MNEQPKPNPDLKDLDRLIGTWKQSGELDGEKGSPAYYRGTFSKDGDTLSGRWVYPGGGYKAVSTRIK
jgi:hypothetical protein